MRVGAERLYFRAVGEPSGESSFLPCLFYTKKQKSKPFDLDFLAGAEGKQGDKQLITVFGEAPEENKEI